MSPELAFDNEVLSLCAQDETDDGQFSSRFLTDVRARFQFHRFRPTESELVLRTCMSTA